ncbi:MAG: molybdopterin-dependent oxidoreductase, partial [Thiolinea sp.]
MAQLALMIDLERCTGCKSCEAACKQTNALGPHTYRNRVMWFSDQHTLEATAVPSGALNFLTVTCQQCERPACLRACPVNPKAISKDPETGVVKIDESRCTGCGECAISCPYGAIGYNAEQHHAVKCDLCSTRREQGAGPACASVCPTRAISFGERDDLLEQARHDERELLEHDHFLQGPGTVYLKRGGFKASEKNHDIRIPALIADQSARANLNASVTTKTYSPNHRQQITQRPETIIPGGCNICFNACPVKYHFRGDELVNVYGNDDDPVFEGRICPKSQMTLQMYGSDQRVLRPLKRVGARGEGKFEPVSWDEALGDIAARLTTVREEYGSKALAIQAGSRTGVLNLLGAIPLFSQLWGTANVASTEPFCDISKVVALGMTMGSTMLGNVYTEDDIGSAAMYVYIGDNQAETRPVNFGLVNGWRLKNRAKMVVVDPRLTATASKADRWLGIRPGTDLALALALAHTIFSEDLADLTFCRDWVLGWENWRDFIVERGYDASWAAPITDLAAEDIKTLAREIAASDGCMIFLSRGINQHSNAAQTNRAFMFVAAITGNWGRKGGGFFNVSAEPDWSKPTVPPERAAEMVPAINKSPAGWLDAMLGEDVYPLKALITGNNPLGQWPNQNKARRAVANLDLVVHMDLYLNETSQYADYVLPMVSGAEKGGPARLAEDRRIVWNDRMMEPPGEAKSDHWFWIELGKRFGFDDVLKEEYKEPRVLWEDVVRASTPSLRGVTIKRLLSKPNRTVRFPVATEECEETGTLYLPGAKTFNQPEGKRFPTPSGKLEFWTEQLEADCRLMGLSALPEFYSEAGQLVDLPCVEAVDV